MYRQDPLTNVEMFNFSSLILPISNFSITSDTFGHFCADSQGF